MHLHTVHPVAAAPATVWSVVGEQFGTISESVAAIMESHLDGPVAVGTARTCRSAAFGPIAPAVLVERLTVFDPQRLHLEYEAQSGMPSFVTGAVNRWSVEALPDGDSLLRVHATLQLRWWARPLGPLLRLRLRSASREALQEIAHRAETGRPHARTIARGPIRPGDDQSRR